MQSLQQRAKKYNYQNITGNYAGNGYITYASANRADKANSINANSTSTATSTCSAITAKIPAAELTPSAGNSTFV